ncbi:hypothetical protein LLEC1_07312 [Akanthomyces lecanii]|uniref:Uncharacterized protein n=1 Tax=Cordyceps confragosa TaxID=2714763 RepID=A0A179I3R5_CORDF|nr:hypothetical protein LLEC1_07312 [Akanthomyces lecanii]
MSVLITEPEKTNTITFVQECPVTRHDHSFTFNHDVVLSSEKLEGVALRIRYSEPRKLSEERSRALMEVIYKVIAWEKGTEAEHPLLSKVDRDSDAKRRRTV